MLAKGTVLESEQTKLQENQTTWMLLGFTGSAMTVEDRASSRESVRRRGFAREAKTTLAARQAETKAMLGFRV